MKRSLILLGVTATMSFISSNLFAAANVTANADVQFEVTGACTIDTASSGTTYGTFNAAYAAGVATNSATATIAVDCTIDMPYKLGANVGANNAGTQRQLLHSNGTDTLNYAVQEGGGTPMGDNLIDVFDSAYVATKADADALQLTGTGAPAVSNIKYVVSRTGGEITGQYVDTVTFVVAWP